MDIESGLRPASVAKLVTTDEKPCSSQIRTGSLSFLGGGIGKRLLMVNVKNESSLWFVKILKNEGGVY